MQSSHDVENTASITVRGGVSPDGGFQAVLRYPVSKEQKAADTSLTTNDCATFLGFEGQGSLLISTANPEAFQIFVNGVQVPLDSAECGVWLQADLSSVAINGDNHLQVCCFSLGDASLEICIPYPVILDATREYLDDDTLCLLDSIIRAEIDSGFPSAQYALVRSGRLIARRAFGLCNSYGMDGGRLAEGAPVTNETLYDIASNTKMYATNFAIQKLVSEDRLDLSKRVNEYIPQFGDGPSDAIRGKDTLTVRTILEHQAGFPADPRYNNIDYDPVQRKVVPGSHANAAVYTQSRDEALSKIIATPLQYKPGSMTLYSDVDYMLLGFIAEEITGQRLDEYVREAF